MTANTPKFQVRLARDARDLLAAQRLRYNIFVSELKGDGALVDHDQRLEKDRYDPICDHLLVVDETRDPEILDDVVGVYRLLRQEKIPKGGSFYSETEYDLTRLKDTGRRLMEIGRSCIHPAYRGGAALAYLWRGLSEYTDQHHIDLVFGTASFHGTDLAALAQPLSFLHYNHLAPEELRVRALPEHYQAMNILSQDEMNQKDAILAMPALIKAYLRLGGCIGDGAFIDHHFNTIDVCLITDTKKMSKKHRDYYSKMKG